MGKGRWIQAMELMPFVRGNEEGTILDVCVQPRASRSEIAGAQQDCLKIRLTAPPVEGEANKECVKLLSRLLGVPKSSVEIIQGQKSRRKTILIRGVAPEILQKTLKLDKGPEAAPQKSNLRGQGGRAITETPAE
jgi:uncharacterized protein